MSRCRLVWAHDLASSCAHEDELGLFDWSAVDDVADVVRYDARGHGSAVATQHYDKVFRWPAMVDDMLRAVKVGPFVAGGVSMGAAVALWTALRAPRRVQGLVLAAPPPAWEARRLDSERYEAGARLVESQGLPAWADELRRRPQPPIFAEALPTARDVSIRHLLAMEERAVPSILRGAASSDLPTREEVRGLVMPALLLAWDDDPAHPLATTEALAELLVLSEVHVARDLADVRAWPKLIADFLGNLCQWEP